MAHSRGVDDRKTLMMPIAEADAYEEALNDALLLINMRHDSTKATLARLRDRISEARIGHWGRR